MLGHLEGFGLSTPGLGTDIFFPLKRLTTPILHFGGLEIKDS